MSILRSGEILVLRVVLKIKDKITALFVTAGVNCAEVAQFGMLEGFSKDQAISQLVHASRDTRGSCSTVYIHEMSHAAEKYGAAVPP